MMHPAPRSTLALLAAACLVSTIAIGQHSHLPPASGVPHGIPRLCAEFTVESVRSGAWSASETWSTGMVPPAGAAVVIKTGTAVAYDVFADAALNCVDVEGRLSFRADRDTRLRVGTLMVLPEGSLEIGTEKNPIHDNITAELIIVDHPIDASIDPEQFGTGLIGLGRVVMHGAVRTPTFNRLVAEPLAGQTRLQLEQEISGWKPGDKLVLPDTRQLTRAESRGKYNPQWEDMRVAAVSGQTVTLSTPLKYDHRGARDSEGRTEFLPHVGNVSRNVIVRSDDNKGTRGHVIFVGRAEVDIRYALFQGLGRTQLGMLDNVAYANNGQVAHVGTNQVGRYSLHFHHVFGPKQAPANGYQFTVIGNAIDDASKWGITVHNSHFGLVQDNVVYDSRGAGIVTEDGTESFNVFAHNFAVRSQGSGEFAPVSGYGGVGNDPGGEGAGFWMRGPNNYVRDNVAANVEVFGYGIAAGALGTVRIPKFKGADTSQSGEYNEIDTTTMEVLQFTGNEAYGAIQTGLAIGWNGTLQNSRMWNITRQAVTALPTDRLTIDRFAIRGDSSVLGNPLETPAGIWFGNYAAKSVIIRNADIQGMRVGIMSPFFASAAEPGRGDGVALIENSYFRDYVGVAVATAYSDPNAGGFIKKAVVRNSRFDTLEVSTAGRYPPAAISMNYGMAPGDLKPRDPIEVIDFNAVAGNSFRVSYSSGIQAQAAVCKVTRPDIGGFICDSGSAAQR